MDILLNNEEADRRTRGYNIRRADDAYVRLRAMPLEQDFTTPGTPSRLGCPFAPPAGRKLSSHAASIFEKHSMTTPRSSVSRLSAGRVRGRASRRPSALDPIQADTCGIDGRMSTAPPSIEGSTAPICPIRFLDQHSPEEVAKYFENHKHEIPRSHEICVKRYQSNSESIRQLDAKYGNLVSMIQGLGQKHQDYLPPEPALTAEEEETRESSNKVKSWAAKLSDSEHEDTENHEEEHEERIPHFDRPMRDVRVGESPSRPWGIPIPGHLAEDPPSSQAAGESKPEIGTEPQEECAPARKCPFDHTKFMNGVPAVSAAPDTEVHEAEPLPEEKPVVVEPPSAPQYCGPPMVFNGPVFIGYSMDQALELLQKGRA